MNSRFYDIWVALFTCCLIVSSITASKLVVFGDLVFSSANLIFPFTYILSDMVTEIYGFRKSRRMIWIGLAGMLLSAVIIQFSIWLPFSIEWGMQEMYENILGSTILVVFASTAAFLVGEFTNAVIMSKLKIKFRERGLWGRIMASSVVAQLLDTSIFVFIAFGSSYGLSILLTILVSELIVKLTIEFLASPLTCRVTKSIKEKEGIDTYDHDETYRPFSIN